MGHEIESDNTFSQLLTTAIYIFAIWLGNLQFSVLVLILIIGWRSPIILHVPSNVRIRLFYFIGFGCITTILLHLIGTPIKYVNLKEGVHAAVRVIGMLLLIFGLIMSINRRSCYCILTRIGLSTATIYALIRPLSLVFSLQQRMSVLISSYQLRGLPISRPLDRFRCLIKIAPAAITGLLIESLESIPALYTKGIRNDLVAVPYSPPRMKIKVYFQLLFHLAILTAGFIYFV